MEKVYDEKFGTSYRPNCAEEYLELLCDIAVDYDGCNTVESLKNLVDELKGYAHKARECLYEGKVFGDRKLTQFKYIKNMNLEEMAEYIVCNEKPCLYCVYNRTDHSNGYDCREGVQKWLESEVQGYESK